MRPDTLLGFSNQAGTHRYIYMHIGMKIDLCIYMIIYVHKAYTNNKKYVGTKISFISDDAKAMLNKVKLYGHHYQVTTLLGWL